MSDEDTQREEIEAVDESAGDEVIVARAGTYYRNARYIMFAILVLLGGWFFYDGYWKYPRQNEEYAALTKEMERLETIPNRTDTEHAELQRIKQLRSERNFHSDLDLFTQRALGCGLPPIAVGLLALWLYRSRGEIRLEQGVLHVPGHPPVPLEQIDELDSELWERKGIAYAYYDRGDGASAKITLDDFIYQAQPIRAIEKAIRAELQAQREEALETEAATEAEADAETEDERETTAS